MKMWDSVEQNYIFDHGWKLDADEVITMTQKQFNAYQYTGKSLDGRKTLIISSTHGCCLIFEGQHFRIV